jgi:hypothetical protein
MLNFQTSRNASRPRAPTKSQLPRRRSRWKPRSPTSPPVGTHCRQKTTHLRTAPTSKIPASRDERRASELVRFGLGPDEALNWMDIVAEPARRCSPDVIGSIVGSLDLGGMLTNFGYQTSARTRR